MKPTKPTASKMPRLTTAAAAIWTGGNRRLLAAATLLFIAFGGVLIAWRSFGNAVVQHPHYVVNADCIVITPQPAWVHVDVKADVIRDGGLDNLPLLDPMVTVKVSRAFELHTWVARVTRVSKQLPAKIIVDVEYRQPVGMVEVNDQGKPGLVPIDGKGIVLPPEDFAERIRDYLRISAGETIPAGPVGMAWGDERVTGGAKLAQALLPYWKKWDLYRIAVSTDSLLAQKASEVIYEVTTREKFRIIWGHAPGHERPGEAQITEKISRLSAYWEKNGGLAIEPNIGLDLRDKQGLILIPQTAHRASRSRQ